MLELPKVYVMMATYNGEKYLREQIDSILAQEGVEVTLRICDDCSADSTFEICNEYQQKDSRVIATQNDHGLGVGMNFMQMVYEVNPDDYDYFAFADQDDFWLKNKLSYAISKFDAKEIDTPTLYYSDVTNVDTALNNGVREYARFSPCSHSLKSLLVMNWASGCTMVFNKQLKELLASYVPASLPRIHDAWVHLVALTCGRTIADLNNSLILRRITGHNQVGVRDIDSIHLLKMLGKALAGKSDHSMTAVAHQVIEGYSDHMDLANLSTLTLFANMPSSLHSRVLVFFDPGYRLPSFGSTIQLKARILANRL